MSNAPQSVLDLIEKFDRNIHEYKNPRYNETLIRVEFVNPFFKALGWDVDNEAGYALAYRDVIHEDEVKVGGATKAPDYSFRIGGTRKFFVETKKPSVNLKANPAPAFQLRRYGYSARLPLSVLTDFEEFIVYDCRIKPSITDKPSVSRIQYYTFREYADNWDEISSIFHRQAILRGSFDKYAQDTKGKKGTAEIDKDFLADLDQWRLVLARNFAIRNQQLTARELNFAVQMTIDRLIFLRMCEDRGIEQYGQLQALVNGTRMYPRLVEVYRRADERYNSGLFHFTVQKGDTSDPDVLTPILNLDDKVLKTIIKNIYYPECPYEFSMLPVEVLGNAYEQFLGKTIRLTTGHQAKIEEKPEVRKAGGVYYTPEYIVAYIVNNTVGKSVAGKTPKKVAQIRILDPACGSGSFLLGAYQYLLDWHLDWYKGKMERTGKTPTIPPHKDKRKRKSDPHAIFQGRGGDWFLSTAEKKRILLNNIHGVDIDQQAVEVTKLSLLLKVLENENQDTLNRQLMLWRERALPDLGNNIKCGNALIAPDFFEGYLVPDEEEMRRVNPFDWETEFPEIMAVGGFDAVIGNPPYIRIQRIEHSVADYLFHTYRTATSKTDLSLLFLERALSLVIKSGLVGFICTSQWLATDYGKNMRRMLSDGQLHEIVDFGSLPVFQKADTYPAIFILSPSHADTLRLKRIQRSDQFTLQAIEDVQVLSIELDSLSEAPWNLGHLDIPTVLKQREVHWKPLQAFGKAYIGLLTGMDKAFVVSREVAKQLGLEESLILPYAYRGAEVRRYTQVHPDARVIYPYREGPNSSPRLISEAKLRQSYPQIYQHLLGYRDTLRKRKDSRKFYAEGANWYRHLRPGSFNHIHPQKFIIKGIDTRTTIGLLEENTAFNGANCPGIIIEDSQDHSPLYILGILNSNAISYYLRMVCPAKLGGYTRFNARNINNTPIRVIDFADSADKARHDKIVELVEVMRELHRKLATASITADKKLYQRQIVATDRQIDELVYELYELTPEEIKVVEETVQ